MEPTGIRPNSPVVGISQPDRPVAPSPAPLAVPAPRPAVIAPRSLPAVPRQILENPADPRTIAWVAAQNARSEAMLAQVALRPELVQRAKELAATNPPLRYERGGNLFAVERGSLTRTSPAGASEVLVDVSKLAPGAAVTDFVISPDGTKVAYGVALFGDDFTDWSVIDLQSKAQVAGPFLLKNIPMTWDHDSSGVFYNPTASREDDDHARPLGIVRYHKLGSDPSKDKVVFDDPDKPTVSRYTVRSVGPDEIYVVRNQGVAEVQHQTRKIVRHGDVFGTGMVDMIAPGHDRGRIVHATDKTLWFRTSGIGDNFGIIAVDKATRAQRTVIAPDPTATLLHSQMIGGKIIMQYMRRDFTNVVRIADLDGKLLREITMDELGMTGRGTLSQFSGDAASKTTEFSYQSVTCPPETFTLDLATFKLSKRPRAAIAYDATKIRDSVHTAKSKDGTMVPLEVYERNDVPTKGTFVFQYGAIGIANSSQWNRIHQLMLEMGFRVVLVHARGGGELGNDWMDQGTTNKQRTLEDISAVEDWVRERWPRDYMVLSGRSFGGMHTLNRSFARPRADAYVSVVPVTDPESWLYRQSGWWARDDFAFPRDKKGFLKRFDLRAIANVRGFSPWRLLQRAKVVKPTYVLTANRDTRVGAQQAYVITDAMQRKFGEQSPVYMTQHIGGH
ncbi:MAG TPA: prolyl oligopeptidase family serine peptidase, partial [Myxococcota bacterium]|nr:prolyl oligopeptidase family serine peptidase [Myxococcota bacterium]